MYNDLRHAADGGNLHLSGSANLDKIKQNKNCIQFTVTFSMKTKIVSRRFDTKSDQANYAASTISQSLDCEKNQ